MWQLAELLNLHWTLWTPWTPFGLWVAMAKNAKSPVGKRPRGGKSGAANRGKTAGQGALRAGGTQREILGAYGMVCQRVLEF